MKRTLVFLLLALALGAACTIFALWRTDTVPASALAGAAVAARETPRVVGGPGRVEPISEEIRVSAEVSGKLEAVSVEEGDRLAAGQVIARLHNADYHARVAAAEATVVQKEAELRRVINGARSQERSEALATVKAAEAVLANARLESARRRALAADGIVSREEADRYERDLRVAHARYDEAVQHHATLDVEAREEDRSRAAAEVALARARLDEVKEMLSKTYVRSPVGGVVLRKHRKAGESVSTQFDSPIVTVADDSRLRVRIDVDETDVGRIRPGQRAYVTADAFPGRKFWGRVVRVGRLLGKKNIQTDEPTERVDTKVLETLVDLDDAHELPLGLRVDAFVVPDQAGRGEGGGPASRNEDNATRSAPRGVPAA